MQGLGVPLPYLFSQSDDFLKTMKKLRKQNPQLYERIRKKIVEILENPSHFKPLSNVLKHYRRAHIGHFVIAFRIVEDMKTVVFVAFDHHDNIYEMCFNE
ncbi:MAG: type II toxin-antitoxin system RelE/ParE family toxin [Candidatus Micrarchaeota archaeon]